MTAIRVRCHGCGREVNSAECDASLRCTSCAARALVAPSLKQYEQLWAKRTRYRRAGAPHAALEAQLGRLAIRISTALHNRIRNPELAGELHRALLSEARQRADTPSGRIVVPRLGQEILGGGARA